MTIESLVIALVSLLIISLLFRQAVMFLSPPTLNYARLEGRLCGSVLIVSNVGRTEANVAEAYAVAGTTRTQITGIPTSIQPGATIHVVMSNPPDSVILAGRNIPVVVLRNECR